MRIRGIDNLTLEQIVGEVAAGGRFVYYEYCVSVVIASARRPSDIFFLRPNDWGLLRGLPYCLLSLLFGWWGFFWGLIYTPLTLFNNLSGGCDVTAEVLAWLRAEADLQPTVEARTLPCDEAS